MNRAPKPRTSTADRLVSRGFSSVAIQSRIQELQGLKVFRNIVKPTQDAHNSMHRRFCEYLALLDDAKYTPDKVLAHGAPHLPLNVVMGFLDYLAMSSQGQIGENITVGTLIGKVGVWIGMMNRINGTAQTTATTQALYRYAGGECAMRYGLKREVRDKPIADGVDISLLLMQLWSSDDTLLSTRMRRQVATYITMAADLASRPGNIVESCAYKNSNEALSYQDLTFYVLPPFNVEHGQTIFTSPNMPTVSLTETPQLLVRVKFRYLKGKRADEDKFVEFALMSDPLATIGHCALTNLIIFALEDKVFQNISSWDDLQHLMTITKKPVIISLKNSDTIRQLPLLRNYIPGTFNISPTKALTYNALYFQIQRVGRRAGFPDRIPLTCFRRKGANDLDESANVTTAQRTAIMGHDPLSRLFLRYQSKLLKLDLHGLAQGREQDLAPIRALGRMSLNADKSAPIAVSVDERKRIWALPEVEALLDEQTKAKRICIAKHGSMGSAKGTPEGESYRRAYSAAKTAIARHERHSFAIERKEWFNNQDTRLLAANPMVSTTDVEDPVSELPTPEQEKDIDNLDLLAIREKFGHIDYNAATGNDIADIFGNGALASVIDASIMTDNDTDHSSAFLCNKPTATTTTISISAHYDPSIHYPPDLFEKLFAGGFPDSGSLRDRFSAWKQLAALPAQKVIPKHTFTATHYKGEMPTSDMKCPDCGDDLTNKTASDRCIHIHSCTRRQKQNEANERINQLFPRMDSNCPFQCNEDLSSAQRSGYSRHLTQHIANRANKAGHDGWQCGVVINGNAICSDRFVTKNDHRVHLQEEHHISAALGLVEFCYWCQEWFLSEEDWYEHCQGHIIAWYLPHKLPNAMPPSIPYPGYNTQMSTGLVTKPGICPFCLWDASQPADVRLNQYGAANLEIHIRKNHYPVLSQTDEHHCPSHACPDSLPSSEHFTLLTLLNHLITAHDIPLNGKRGKSHTGALPVFDQLPNFDVKKPKQSKTKVLSSTLVVENEGGGPSMPSKRTKAESSPGYQSREKLKRARNVKAAPSSTSLKENKP